ncbi:MAG TPA: molybdopterin cofactor-binding domain-containing protein [Vicinamibacterales bacterium]|jgi:selenium-dependent xanthine dehydrogenase|nr:molybdopterin cofactor-binding domain-containing protein [Vicinamibacterales bacterium]
MPHVKFHLNGKDIEAHYEPGMHLLEVLREECGITSCKNGCAPEGACGCCLVNIDGKPALSCLRKPEQMADHDIRTLEGFPERTRRIIADAFVLEGGVQCGFCIPGIVVRAAHLIEQGKTSDRDAIRKALDGHICRCTGYGRIIDAIQTAGEALNNGGTLPGEPRRHSYFGEEFGLHRNPQFDVKGHGIGGSHARVGGAAQVLGERPYIDDMKVDGMLHGAMVLAEHPRAKVLAIHTEEAARSQGVARIFTARDVPGERGTGLAVSDLPMFVAIGEVTCCVGDFIAMVVADTQFHARQAAKKIKVDYEVLEPITDPFKALDPVAPRVHSDDAFRPAPNVIDFPTKFGRGDAEAAFATAAHVIEATYKTQPVDIAFLEPESCLAYPQGQGIKVHSESQGSQFDQKTIAKALNLSESDVEVALAASGGAFGAKEELSIQAQTAMAAYLLGRPVKTTLTREQSTQHHVKRHPMTIKLKVGADADGHLLVVKARIVGDAGGYAGTSGKCLLRAACHSCGPYRVPNVDVESIAVYTNNPTSGAMRGFGTNQAHFAIEGVMDILAEKIGVDGWEIRWRNILNPGDQFATGQLMRESVRGLRESLNAVKDIYRSEKFAGVSCGIKSTGIGNGTTEEGRVVIRVIAGDQVQILNGYTEMGQGLYTATMQAVCEETGLPDSIMNVLWDKELGAICGETWASRATTLSCAAAQKAAQKLAADLKTHSLGELAGREYMGNVVYSFTTKPGTPEAQKDPTTHFTFSYATQVVILDEAGHLQRVVAAHDVGRAINPRLCAEQMEGGVHMGLGYALSENFTSTNGRPDSLKMRDFGLVPAKQMPEVDIILIEVPDEYGGYGAKGVGEIGCVATASAVAAALYSYDGKRRFTLPMDDAPAALPLLPKSRRH